MKRFLVLLLMSQFGITNSISQSPAETSKRIKQKIETREYDAAIADLEKLRAADPVAFATGDRHYLLARIAETNGDLALAQTNYQAVANRGSALTPYARMHLSQIARSTGNLMLERLYLSEIALFSPDSMVAKSVDLRLARISFEQENYGETIRILTGGEPSNRHSAPSRETRSLLGNSYVRIGQIEKARAIFASLLDTVPVLGQPDDTALAAVQNLDLIDGGTKGSRVPDLAEAEHSRRAGVYQFNREFADAKLHYEALIANYPTGANTPEAIFQIGRGFAQQNSFGEALKWYERAIEQYPQSSAAKDALLQAASAYGRVGRPKEAITRYQNFIDKYPSDEKLDRAYLNMVDIMRDQGENTDAIRICEKVREVFKGKLPEAIALFTESRIYFAREEWQSAFEVLDQLSGFSELGGSSVPGGTSIAEVAFLKGFALEQLKKYPEAIGTYLSVADGRGEYNGWRATERLRGLARIETAKPFFVEAVGRSSTLLEAGSREERYRNARSLLRLTAGADIRERSLTVLRSVAPPLPKHIVKRERPVTALTNENNVVESLTSLGLYDEAAIELAAVTPNLSKLPIEKSRAIIETLNRGDRADLVMEFIEPVWKPVAADYPIDLMPREALEMLYPAPYKNHLLRHASGFGVDRRLLLAIMRQESRFQPNAKSFAAARGLMQFISTTSTHVAGELEIKGFSQDDLYSPANSILFGAHYVKGLFSVFPEQPDAVVASYNGGDDNMKRWLARSRSNLPERYVPEIMFAQTKDYVYKVMANYRMYKYLYDADLRPVEN